MPCSNHQCLYHEKTLDTEFFKINATYIEFGNISSRIQWKWLWISFNKMNIPSGNSIFKQIWVELEKACLFWCILFKQAFLAQIQYKTSTNCRMLLYIGSVKKSYFWLFICILLEFEARKHTGCFKKKEVIWIIKTCRGIFRG